MKVSDNWFETWFDSPYYHILYQHRDEEEAADFIDNLCDFLQPGEGAKVLDLACGKGRHALYLCKKGLNVTGIDLSPKSIEAAKKLQCNNLEFFIHDMRKPFRENSFQYIFNFFTSFGYFTNKEDDYAAIDAVAGGLVGKGIFVLDFMNVTRVALNLVPEEKISNENIDFFITRKLEDDFIIKEIKFTDNGNHYTFHEKVQALTLDDFRKFFESAGLTLLHQFGDYQLNEYDEQNSKRLILVAEK